MNDREQWLKDRQTGIGSSDAANLIGIGFRSALDVYYSKIDAVRVDVVEPELQRGIDLEPIIARKYAETMDKELSPAGFIRSAVNPWQISNPDFTGIDDRYTEIKSVGFFDDEWGEPFTDDFPDKYKVQCQHQMGVRVGCDHMDLAAFSLLGWELRVYRIRFDAEFFAWLTEIEGRAWRMIEARRPLAHDWNDQFREEYQRRQTKDGQCLELPTDLEPALAELDNLKAVEKDAKAGIESLRATIERQMGQVERATCGPWTIKRTVTSNHQVRYTYTNAKGKK